MTRLISLCLLLFVAACTTTRTPVEYVSIAEDIEIRLPRPPGFPGQYEDQTRLRLSANGEGGTVNAIIQMTPDLVFFRISHPTGPTLLEADWTADGIVERRAPRVPQQLRAEEMLATLFIALWPAEQVRAALPAHASLKEYPDGRAIEAMERTVLAVRRTRRGLLIDHFDYGYNFEVAGLNLQ